MKIKFFSIVFLCFVTVSLASASSVKLNYPDFFILILKGNENVKKTFSNPKDGLIKIPEKLFIQQGLGLGSIVTVTYNKVPAEDVFDFICTYKSKHEVDNLPLEKCVDMNNQDLGNVSNVFFPLIQNNEIELKLLNPNNTNLEIHAWHEVEWK